MQKKILATLFAIALVGNIMAQGNIGGQIISNNEPLIGASILIKGATLGTTTDTMGIFFLENIPNGEQTIVISYIGYSTKEVTTTIINNETVLLGIIELKEGEALEEVVIEGKMVEGERKAILKMIESKNVTQIKSAEGIAKLPDKNAAEALQRMPGVVMESDHGEGQYISFRGTPTDWSTVTINGDRMPVANEEVLGRALNLDVLPTSLLDYIEYNQTLLPSIEGDAIGGNANFITRQIPDEFMLEVSVASGYNQKAQKPIFNASILTGGRSKNKKFGFVGGASYFARNWSTDNYEIFYGSNLGHSLTRLELRKYNGLRTTSGAHFKVDFRPSAGNELYLMGFGGMMSDNEYNRKTMYNWVTGVGQSIILQNINNILQHQMAGGALGGSHQLTNKLKLDWEAASYAARFQYGNVPFSQNDDRNGYYVLEYEKLVEFTDFLFVDENGNQVTIDDDYDQRFKYLEVDSPVEGYGDNYWDISPTYMVNQNPFRDTDTMFTFTKAFTETNSNIEQDPIVLKIDLDYKHSQTLKFAFGGKFRNKVGTRSVGLEAWQRNPFNPAILVYDLLETADIPNAENYLAETGGNYTNRAGQFATNDALADFIPDNLADSTIIYLPFGSSTPFYPQFVGGSFRYAENAYSAYAMFNWDVSNKLNITGGLRYELTDVQVIADTVIKVVPPTGGDVLQLLEETTADRTYHAVLPMIAVNWSFAKESKLILSSTRSYRRVNFNEIKPGEAEIHYTHFHSLLGNPDLRPTFAINNDLSIQRYFGLEGYASISLFHKHVVDHIYTAFQSDVVNGNTTAGQFAIPGGIVAKRYENAEWARVYGFEVAIERRFSALKIPVLQNMGIGLNYAYSESDMKIDARKELQPLTRQAKHVVNARLSYTSKSLEVNAGLNYRSPYLMELNLFAYYDPNLGELIIRQSNDFDNYMGRSLSLDATASYKLNEHFTITLDLLNLLNTEYVQYRGVRERPIKTEFYGVRGLVSLKYRIGKVTHAGKFHQEHGHSH